MTLYFLSGGAEANPYGREAVFDLEFGTEGAVMKTSDASPQGGTVERYWEVLEREENLKYQATLVEAPDRWLWSMLYAPTTKSYSFDVTAPADTGESSRLTVWLQGEATSVSTRITTYVSR